MGLHLVTGYKGEPHITSADQGAYNIATYGGGEFVLDRGNKFVTTLVSNNAVTIADGEAMMQGRYIRMTPGTSETVAIDNGTTGMKRNDLICLRYEKDPSTNEESTSFVVVKGTETASTPEDPEYTQGDITDGDDLVNEMPLYRVYINGLNVETITPLFSVYVSMKEYMDEYQLPVASSNRLGGIKVPSTGGLQMGSDNGLYLKGPSETVRGGVLAYSSETHSGNMGLYDYNGGFLKLCRASDTRLGGVRTGRGIYNSYGDISVQTDHVTYAYKPLERSTIHSRNRGRITVKVLNVMNTALYEAIQYNGFISAFVATWSLGSSNIIASIAGFPDRWTDGGISFPIDILNASDSDVVIETSYSIGICAIFLDYYNY